MKPRYKPVKDGEAVQIPGRLLKISCCDCGLVHVFKLRKRGRGLTLRAWRDVRSTAGKRNRLGIKIRRTR